MSSRTSRRSKRDHWAIPPWMRRPNHADAVALALGTGFVLEQTVLLGE
jgi:hypothetical protein